MLRRAARGAREAPSVNQLGSGTWWLAQFLRQFRCINVRIPLEHLHRLVPGHACHFERVETRLEEAGRCLVAKSVEADLFQEAGRWLALSINAVLGVEQAGADDTTLPCLFKTVCLLPVKDLAGFVAGLECLRKRERVGSGSGIKHARLPRCGGLQGLQRCNCSGRQRNRSAVAVLCLRQMGRAPLEIDMDPLQAKQFAEAHGCLNG